MVEAILRVESRCLRDTTAESRGGKLRALAESSRLREATSVARNCKTMILNIQRRTKFLILNSAKYNVKRNLESTTDVERFARRHERTGR